MFCLNSTEVYESMYDFWFSGALEKLFTQPRFYTYCLISYKMKIIKQLTCISAFMLQFL